MQEKLDLYCLPGKREDVLPLQALLPCCPKPKQTNMLRETLKRILASLNEKGMENFSFNYDKRCHVHVDTAYT